VNASSDTLFDDVVKATRLVDLIAPFTVSRLLVGAGVSPREMTREELAQALPHLERGLAIYLRDDELETAIADIRALAAT
jgi:hypothetical protein